MEAGYIRRKRESGVCDPFPFLFLLMSLPPPPYLTPALIHSLTSPFPLSFPLLFPLLIPIPFNSPLPYSFPFRLLTYPFHHHHHTPPLPYLVHTRDTYISKNYVCCHSSRVTNILFFNHPCSHTTRAHTPSEREESLRTGARVHSFVDKVVYKRS